MRCVGETNGDCDQNVITRKRTYSNEFVVVLLKKFHCEKIK